MAEVRAHGYVVVRDRVCDISRFVDKHKGGGFLWALRGRDATLLLENAHGKSPAMRRMLERFAIGAFDESTRDPLERDLIALGDDLRRDGLFEYSRARIVFDCIRWVTLLALASLALRFSSVLSFALLLAATIDVVWWIHDAGHDAIFGDEKTARKIIEVLGIVVLGMPQQGYHYGVHRIHHAFANVVDVDRALETGTLSWEATTAAKKPTLFRRARLAQWFFMVVPLAGPALLYSAVAYAVTHRQVAIALAVLVRWSLWVAFCFAVGAPLWIVAPWVAGSVLAFMAGLNHFHLPMSREAPESYAHAVFERTQNIAAGPLWRWISGGLDLHVEHHLFSTMPSRNYVHVSPRLRAVAARHGITVRTATRWGAIKNLIDTLQRPLADAASGRERHDEPREPRETTERNEVSGIRRRP